MAPGIHLKYKHYLVTGASGFVGTHQVNALVEKGFRVTACDLADSDGGKFAGTGVKFVPVDITRKFTLDGLMEDVDVVMHVAAIFDYSAPWNILKRVNVKGTRNVCEAAAEQGVKKLVCFSSCDIYGDPAHIPADEHCKVRPTHDYGESKFLGEREAFRVSVTGGLPVTVLRPAAPYGPGSNHGAVLLLNMLYKGILPGIPGDGKARIHLVHVEDVVNAAIFLAGHPDSAGQEYNLSDDTPMELREVLSYAAGLLDKRMPELHIPRQVAEMFIPFMELYANLTRTKPLLTRDMLSIFYKDHAFDNSKIKALGYKLLYPDVREGFSEIMEWYKGKSSQ